MNTSLRGKLQAAQTLAELGTVWVLVARAYKEHMSDNTYRKCVRVYEAQKAILV